LSERTSLVLSCEHGGHEVPLRYEALFASAGASVALESHRGWDPGAADLAEELAERLGAPLTVQRTTRLLVECNRSIGHEQLWSEFSRALPEDEREHVLSRYWHPHRREIERAVRRSPAGLVVHVGVHTFTTVWKGRRRSTDIGLLCDSSRAAEVGCVEAWRKALSRHRGSARLTVHRNRPYRGWTDGLVTDLRKRLPPRRYAGIELEVSQALVPVAAALVEALAEGLKEALASIGGVRV
jgi:predicted N-formylglutamate amidohydrolase